MKSLAIPLQLHWGSKEDSSTMLSRSRHIAGANLAPISKLTVDGKHRYETKNGRDDSGYSDALARLVKWWIEQGSTPSTGGNSYDRGDGKDSLWQGGGNRQAPNGLCCATAACEDDDEEKGNGVVCNGCGRGIAGSGVIARDERRVEVDADEYPEYGGDGVIATVSGWIGGAMGYVRGWLFGREDRDEG